jgi:hypothetical protein
VRQLSIGQLEEASLDEILSQRGLFKGNLEIVVRGENLAESQEWSLGENGKWTLQKAAIVRRRDLL